MDNTSIQKLITHQIGNKGLDEGMNLSQSQSTFQEDSQNFLLQYFLSQFQFDELNQFTHSVDLNLNEVFVIVSKMFDEPNEFIQASQQLTTLLYEKSVHPKIKSGELNIVTFNDVLIDDELFEAVGLFKSETNVPYITMNQGAENYGINHQFGYDLKGIDKACLIVNTEREDGFLVLVVDKTSRDAQYWQDDFLQIKPIANEFLETKDFLEMTKQFLSAQASANDNMDKTDKIDIINGTVDFFKSNEVFEQEAFEETVLKDQKIIDSFRDYAPSYAEENKLNISNSFTISDQAVKKQVRRFKSILKLDKNFQIYIKRNNSLIEKGVEPDGRKFYKFYYEHEE